MFTRIVYAFHRTTDACATGCDLIIHEAHPIAPEFHTAFPELPTHPEFRQTKDTTGDDLVIYEVEPVRTRIVSTFPRITDGF